MIGLIKTPLLELHRIAEGGSAQDQAVDIAARFKEEMLAQLASSNGKSDAAMDEDALLLDVPSMNENGQLPNGSLVRFRAMVQDNGLSLQFYSCRLNVRHRVSRESRTLFSYFSDGFPLLDEDWIPEEAPFDQQAFSQKSPLFCVESPAEARWVGRSPSSGEQSLEETIASVAALNLQDVSPLVKQKIPPSLHSASQRRSKVAIVKLYDDAEVKLNEVLEFYGVLQMPDENPAEDDGMDHVFEDDAGRFTDVPVLHCIFHKRVSEYGHSSLLKDLQLHAVNPAELKEKALSYLRNSLLGDSIVAEYVLASLVSKVHGLKNDVPVGFMPLNIFNIPPDDSLPKKIFEMLENLVPRCSYLPLSIQTLNRSRFAPRFSLVEENGEPAVGLVSGVLQLPSQTLVVVDETGMAPGKLDDRGVKNFHHVKHLIENASVTYEFGTSASMQDREFPIDCNVLVLSHGKCMFGMDFTIPLIPTTNEAQEQDEESIHSVRSLISWAKTRDYSIPNELNEIINQDYANGRQEDFRTSQKRHTPESLMTKLELARCLTLVSGEQQLTASIWKRVSQLEDCRFQRIAAWKKTGNGLTIQPGR
ncbi:hypothetical protein HDU67_002995 [Dinochytrium kinnereticum]|nr:hypothetical protein HDU67_002995 [Dinochytrium kinnereticum]